MTIRTPHYSVVVPAYNAEKYIREAIASVFAQSESDWELIVVDDGSTDATATVVAGVTDERITLIRQENRGVSVARNNGFAASHGEYVLFLDADDILFPDALARLGRELDAYPEAVLAFGGCARFYTTQSLSTARVPLSLRKKRSGDVLATFLTGDQPMVGTALAPRQAIARVDGFDPALTMYEDWAFWCDLAALGPVRYIGRRPVLAYRFHGESAMRKLSVDPRAGWPALDRVFTREAVRRRFSTRELARMRRHIEASSLGGAAREFVRRCGWGKARRLLWESVKRDPARPGNWALLAFAVLGRLPKPARRLLD